MRARLSAIVAVLTLTGSFAVAAVVATATAADAANVTIPLTCQTTGIPVLGTQVGVRSQAAIGTAPANAYQNDVFTVSLQPAPDNLSADAGSGATLNHVKNFKVHMQVPANATLLSYNLSGGSNYGGVATVSQAGSHIIMSVPGPISPGVNFQFPSINLSVRATGAPLSQIIGKMAGTSFSDPGLELTANATLPAGLGTADLPTSCYPSSSIAASTTLILPPDTVPPSITINAPADGATFAVGAVVNASFTCDDGPFGKGVATCTAKDENNTTILNGQPIDTSVIGTHSITVTSTDNVGNGPSTATTTYNVSGAAGVSVSGGWGTEGVGQSVPFTFAITKPTSSTMTVNYSTQNGTATSGADFTTTTGTITFSPGGSQRQVVNVPLVNNGTYETPETFAMNITGVTNGIVGAASADGRVRDDEIPAVRVEGGSVTRGPGATVPMTISLEGPPSQPLTVNYATADNATPVHAVAGTDYTATNGSLTFNPGAALSQTVNVPVATGAAWKADALTFDLNATITANSQTASAAGTIIDANVHPPVMSIGNVTVSEGTGAAKIVTVPVTLDRKVPFPVTIRYSTVAGTAEAGSDYVAKLNKSLVFQANQISKTIGVSVKADADDEGTESFTVVLSPPTVFAGVLSSTTGTVTILDDDAAPATPTFVIGDAEMTEGDSVAATLKVPVRISPTPTSTVTVWYQPIPGTATVGDYVYFAPKKLTFLAGNNLKWATVKIYNDLTVESDETFTLHLSSPSAGTAIGDGDGTVTIIDNDNPIPTTPSGMTAKASNVSLGGVELNWSPSSAPFIDWPITTYEYRRSTNGGTSWGAWAATNSTSPSYLAACGEGVTCDFEVRAKNRKGVSPGVTTATGVGSADSTAPVLTIESPLHRGNIDKISNTTLTGNAGFDTGDSGAIPVQVYACDNCTNIAPTVDTNATVVGGTWSVNAALSPGIYTAVAAQSDWDAQTTSAPQVVFQVRDAIFVSPFGSDANVGSSVAPKLTIANAVTTAIAQGRPQIAIASGTFAPASGVTVAGNVALYGGFDEFSSWTRPGSAGVSGTPDRNLTTISGSPQAVTVSGNVNVTLDGMTLNALNAGLGAGASVYGVRAVGASAGAPAAVTINNAKVNAQDATNGTNSSVTGSTPGSGGCTGANGLPYFSFDGNGMVPNGTSCGGSGVSAAGYGGGGGEGFAFSAENGKTGGGGGGGALGGAGGSGSFTYGGPGAGGNGGAAGTAGTAGSKGTNTTSLAGGTWVGQNGGTGGNGTSGGGGGGGGGGGATGAYVNGGRGGGGGGGGLAGGGGGAGTAGGGSFGVYAFNASVTVTASLLTAGAGGGGGNGASGGNGTSGGNGGNAFSQPLGGNGAGGGGGGGGAAGGGGGGGAGGPSATIFHAGSGTVSTSTSTLNRSLSPSFPGTGGNGGNGGAAGIGGADGGSGEICTLICGDIPSGTSGGAGPSGNQGNAGDPGLVCSKLDAGICTP